MSNSGVGLPDTLPVGPTRVQKFGPQRANPLGSIGAPMGLAADPGISGFAVALFKKPGRPVAAAAAPTRCGPSVCVTGALICSSLPPAWRLPGCVHRCPRRPGRLPQPGAHGPYRSSVLLQPSAAGPAGRGTASCAMHTSPACVHDVAGWVGTRARLMMVGMLLTPTLLQLFSLFPPDAACILCLLQQLPHM